MSFVIQDELTIAPSVRVAVENGLRAARLASGLDQPLVFVSNLTMRSRPALEVAKELGGVPGSGVMVNLITMGTDIVEEIRSVAPQAVIFGNIIGRGMIASGCDYYITEEVMCRFARLSGADVIYIGSFLNGVVQTRKERCFRLRTALASPIVEGRQICRATAAMSGGNDLAGLWRNLQLYDGPVTCLMGRKLHGWYQRGLDARAVAAAMAVLRRGAVQESEIEFLREVRTAIEHVARLDHAECLRTMGLAGVHAK